jgi:hypothetical protein
MNNNELKFLATCPEYQSVEAFFDDNETGLFTSDDLNVLNYTLRAPIQAIKEELEGYGMRLRARPVDTRTRGYRSNDNDRWDGPGSAGY